MLRNRRIIFYILFTIIVLVLGIKYFAFNNTSENYDVDLVYLWCDGDEPEFKARKNYWLKQENKEPSKDAVSGRYEQVDELKYSLRSVEAYLPWLRHIYIVTDMQIPVWLNTNHPKITVVDISEIIPSKYLPVFNSNAIESTFYKIPGLSEHFLYANDDMFVNRPLTKDFFFHKGKPIVRMMPTSYSGSLYYAQILYVTGLSERAFGSKIPFFSARNLVPHHNIDAYLKSDFEDCVNYFKKEFEETLTHRFRQVRSLQRLIVSIWSVVKKHAEVKIVYTSNQPETIDSLYLTNEKESFANRIKFKNPGLFCINDTGGSTWEDRKRTKQFLEERFPKKSEFEL